MWGMRITGGLALALFVAAAGIGCGTRGVGATCTGVVTIDGQPVPAGVLVEFQPPGPQGSPSLGITDATGKFELRFTAARKGVMPGECLVRLSVMPEIGADGIPAMPEALKTVRIPEHYGRQSKLTRTVKPGHNTINIEIDTKSAIPKTK